jgi:predicted nucleic acid-binding Zn ribbon protein
MPSREPRHIADVLSALMARRGYGRVQSADACAKAWRQAAGERIAECTRATAVRRGVLEVLVTNSTLVQEMTFEKRALIERLTALAPDENIRDLRFRVGPIA